MDAKNPFQKKAPDGPRRLGLRPKEAAEAIGIGERLLWQLTKDGEIPHVRVGRAVIYPVAELERWLAERAAKTESIGP